VLDRPSQPASLAAEDLPERPGQALCLAAEALPEAQFLTWRRDFGTPPIAVLPFLKSS